MLTTLYQNIAEFQALKVELKRVYFDNIITLNNRAPGQQLEACGFRWIFFHHGCGILFRRLTKHPLTVDIQNSEKWFEFDSWTILSYIRTRLSSNKRQRRLHRCSEKEIVMLLDQLCEINLLVKINIKNNTYILKT